MIFRFKRKIIGNLGEIEGGFLNQFFCPLDLQIQKAIDDASPVFFGKFLLDMGGTEGEGGGDLIDGDPIGEMLGEIMIDRIGGRRPPRRRFIAKAGLNQFNQKDL